jgi:hypothetical protein
VVYFISVMVPQTPAAVAKAVTDADGVLVTDGSGNYVTGMLRDSIETTGKEWQMLKV